MRFLLRVMLIVFGLALVLSTGVITILRWDAEAPMWIVFHSGSVQTSDDIYRMNPDGSQVQQVTSLPEDEVNPAWSPDGRWIAFIRSARYQSDTDLYLMASDGRHIQPLQIGPAIDFAPSWSPDGKWLLLISLSDQFDQHIDDIYRLNVDSREMERLPTDDSCAEVATPKWSPDGKSIVFAAYCTGGMDIYRMDLASNQIQRLTDHPEKELFPSWSPDGRWITFSVKEDDGYNIYRMTADGNQRQRLTNQPGDETMANWSPDGQWIVFAAGMFGTFSDIYRMRPDGSELERLTHSPNESDLAPSWSPLFRVPFHPIISIIVGMTCIGMGSVRKGER